MQELIAQVFSYIWGIWRFRWLALLVTWVVAIGGWFFVYQMPESYVATARVHVDTNSVLRPLLHGLAIEPNIDQRITMMSRTLLSRPNLEKVMRMTDLDLQVQSELEKENLLEELRTAISLGADRSNYSLYSIEVKHSNGEVAKRITQALITVFIESSLNNKREDSSGAKDFLDEQIGEYEQRLVEAEDRLATFKQRHAGSLPGADGGYYPRLQQAKAELSDAELRLREMRNRRNELKRQIDGEEPVLLSIGNAASVSAVDTRIQKLQSQLDLLLARYTEKHPEVQQIQALIADLEAEKNAAGGGSSRSGFDDFAGLSNSPVYQSMRNMMAEAEASVAELEVRVAEYRKRVEALEARVNNVPVIETELKQLDRDYQVIASQHKALLARRETAKLSQDVERSASDVTFRVIDPPFVPTMPSEPNKVLLNSAVLVIALGAGTALALLVSLIKPVIVDQQSLIRVTGLPLLGTVSLIPAAGQKRREALGLLAFSSLGVLILLAYVGLNVGQRLMMA